MKKIATITKLGKPVAKPTPTGRNKHTDDLFGFMAGKVTITGDVVAPAFSPEEWSDLYFPSRPRRRPR
jgi:antitoxin (DNA-binding transcriptional repressor) of toxin-antitoxin stability system